MTPRLYPLFLKLSGHPVLVVGGGTIARRKIESLLESGAEVCVVSPKVVPEVESMVEAGRVEWVQSPFEPTHLAGKRLVVAASSSQSVNELVAQTARDMNIWINTVDVPELCDFYVPSVVDRNPLLIAVSTMGQAPAFARKLRKELETLFPPTLGDYVGHLGDIRESLRAMGTETLMRVAKLIASSSARERWLSGDMNGARKQLEQEVNEHLRQDRSES